MSHSIILNDYPTDGLWVQSIMSFPTNSFLRNSWFALESTSAQLHELEGNPKIEIDLKSITALIEAPSYSELESKRTESIKKGLVAGEVLAYLYVMHLFEMEEPSMNKAIQIAQQYAESNEYGDGSKMCHSERTIKKYFNEFKTVSHLWAAFRLNDAYPYCASTPFLSENLNTFLQISAGLLEFGKFFIASRSRDQQPILSSTDMWELPENTPILHLNKDAPYPDLLAKLYENYTAMEYRY